MRLADPTWLYGLWLAPALALLCYAAMRRRRALLRRFADARLLPALGGAARAGRRAAKATLLIGALALIVFALARPEWNPRPRDVRARGRDVLFVVDVSRSMLADDLKPSRLERAKLAIADALNVIQGDRVGLIAFAGSAVMRCPLTLDYGFLREALDSLSPESVQRGGTNIGDAIRDALNVFDDDSQGYRDIVLITDGEDHENFPVQAAEKAAQQGVRIIAIGLGDEKVGHRVPIVDERGRQSWLTYDGQEVLSKLDADTLRKVATASKDGVYLNVATGNINLDQVYADLIRSAQKRDMESRSAVRYDEKFYIFLGAALALLTAEAFIGERRKA